MKTLVKRVNMNHFSFDLDDHYFVNLGLFSEGVAFLLGALVKGSEWNPSIVRFEDNTLQTSYMKWFDTFKTSNELLLEMQDRYGGISLDIILDLQTYITDLFRELCIDNKTKAINITLDNCFNLLIKVNFLKK